MANKTKYPGIYWYMKRGRRAYEAYASYGTRQRHSRGFVSLDAAKSWQDATLADYRSGRVGKASARLTFDAYWTEKWWPFRQPTLKPTSQHTYRSIGNRLRFVLGELKLKDIEGADIDDLITSMAREGLSLATRNITYRIIHECLEDARRWKLIPTNPADEADTPDAPAKREVPTLSKTDLHRLFEVAQEHSTTEEDFGLMAYFGITAGMRYSELAAWEKRHIYFDARELRIPKSKSKSGVRTIALDGETVAMLRELVADLADTDKVCRLRSYSSFNIGWKKIATAAGFPGLHFHDTRHLHATLLARAGIHPSIAQRRVGHSRSSFTLDVYTEVADEDSHKAAATAREFLQLPVPYQKG